MKAIVNDPKVLSILEKSRGEKGYRFHQGNRLHLLLSSLKQNMVNYRVYLLFIKFLFICGGIYEVLL